MLNDTVVRAFAMVWSAYNAVCPFFTSCAGSPCGYYWSWHKDFLIPVLRLSTNASGTGWGHGARGVDTSRWGRGEALSAGLFVQVFRTHDLRKLVEEVGVGRGHMVKTEDIHPPKTGISVHFCVLSLMAMQN